MELESIILSEVCQAQKYKNSMYSSYADYRPKKCSNIIGHGSHTKGRLHTGGIQNRKETKYLNVVDVLTYRNECSNLQWTGATMGRGLASSEEVWWR
jgi:hypothetical protein